MNRLQELIETSKTTTKPAASADTFSPRRADDVNNNNNDDDDDAGNDNHGVEINIASGSSSSAALLERTLSLVEVVRQNSTRITQLTAELRAQTAKSLKSDPLLGTTGAKRNSADTSSEDSNNATCASVINDIMNDVSRIAKENRSKLTELEDEHSTLLSNAELATSNPAVCKLQQFQIAHLTRNFLDVMHSFHCAVNENDTQQREQVVRRIRIKYTKLDGTTLTDEEARAVAEQVLELGHSDVLMLNSKELLNQVLETRHDILRIERSMRELMQMMEDLSTLVYEQDHLMGVVTEAVKNTVEIVGHSNKILADTRNNAKESSSKMKWIVGCAVVLFLIILASTLGATLSNL